MKRTLIWLSILAVVFVGGKRLLEKTFTAGEEHNAQERVRQMLDGMKTGGDLQRAICLWKQGSYAIQGQGAFDTAATEYEAWTARKGIRRISDYTIDDVVVLSETERLGEAIVIVSGRMDGKAFQMRVVQGYSIEWVP